MGLYSLFHYFRFEISLQTANIFFSIDWTSCKAEFTHTWMFPPCLKTKKRNEIVREKDIGRRTSKIRSPSFNPAFEAALLGFTAAVKMPTALPPAT